MVLHTLPPKCCGLMILPADDAAQCLEDLGGDAISSIASQGQAGYPARGKAEFAGLRSQSIASFATAGRYRNSLF